MQLISLSAPFLFPLLMVVAGTGDVLSRRIPNWLTLVTALSFFPLAWAAGLPWATILIHVGTGCGLLLIGFLIFSLGFFGGGDAKLLAAAGVWFGPTGLAAFMTMTVLAGGILSVVVLVWSIVRFDAELRGSGLSRRPGWLKPSIPYGYAIAAGVLLASSESWWSAPSVL